MAKHNEIRAGLDAALDRMEEMVDEIAVAADTTATPEARAEARRHLGIPEWAAARLEEDLQGR